MDFLYHNAIGAFIAVSSFVTLEYISDPQNFFSNLRDYVSRMQYWSIDKVVSIYTLYNDIQNKINPPERVDESVMIFSYDDDGNLNPPNDEPARIYRRMMKNDKSYYVDYSILTSGTLDGSSGSYQANFTPFEDAFIDITLDYDGVTYNIKRHLEKFTVIGHVLEGYFFRAFMKHFYNVDVIDNFTLSGIDSNFNNFTYTQDDVIRITEEGVVSGYIGVSDVEETVNEEEQNVTNDGEPEENECDTEEVGNVSEGYE